MEADPTKDPPMLVRKNKELNAIKVGSERGRFHLDSNADSTQQNISHDADQALDAGNTARSFYCKILMQKDQETLQPDKESEKEGDLIDDFDSNEETNEVVIKGLYIQLNREEKKRIQGPWRNTLIVKLLGRGISYTYLCNRVKQLWSLIGDFQVKDFDNGYHCFRFNSRVDYNYVLSKEKNSILNNAAKIQNNIGPLDVVTLSHELMNKEAGNGKQYRRKIVTLKREDDTWCYDQVELENLILQFYKRLYADDGVKFSLLKSSWQRLDEFDVLPIHIVHMIAVTFIDPLSDDSDIEVWLMTNDGEFSVKTAY
ncbi:Uncharacterized protein TCM_040554 [Theobroma cacao]|uniref:DUF4283 domain-containing protein n=1 Tax=Theobroma cacao TaxID=3641 RepID=A0A061GTR4_THECC|nr:Uncharacterized protein TCM_040554 [Theobroma cacao]